MCSATRPRRRRNEGAARQLPVRRRAIRDCRPLDAILALPLPAVPEGAWRAIPHAGAGRRRRFPLSRRRGACSFYQSTPGTHRGFCKVCGAPVLVKFEENSRSAQTDPRAVALYGVALATLDDNPGLRPDAHAFIVDKAPWFTVTDDLPDPRSAYPRPERTTQFLTGRSPRSRYPPVADGAEITNSMKKVPAAELNARCWSSQGTLPGARENVREAPKPAVGRIGEAARLNRT